MIYKDRNKPDLRTTLKIHFKLAEISSAHPERENETYHITKHPLFYGRYLMCLSNTLQLECLK